ncbi:hypothetical protein PCIT_b0421 [Pseudoalteromonas citrea]|uniref:Uncharacterized protein n=1 Tax=Pseudoalteromonas citrea TaxID=43655 RepID=A0AAD4AEL1_9GAMM|nr:hypothetical protein PCIT_b0421 [Pseudoalteromonas citrea]
MELTNMHTYVKPLYIFGKTHFKQKTIPLKSYKKTKTNTKILLNVFLLLQK